MQNLFSEKNLEYEELKSVYRKLISHFHIPTLLLMRGPAGIGKTESVRMIADILGYQQIASPSFAIIHHYQNTTDVELTHVDLYRLQNDDDLESSGFWDLFSNEKQIVVIEWSDRLDVDSLPMNWQRIVIEISQGNLLTTRNIQISILPED